MSNIINISVKIVGIISITVAVQNTVAGGAFVDVDIFHSDGTVLVASKSSGETFDIPKHSIFESDGATLVEENEFDVNYTTPNVKINNSVGDLKFTQEAGEDKNISKHDIILPDGVTNLESKEFDEDTQLVRAYNRAALTGQTSQRRVGDDVWQRDNGTYNYTTLGIRPLMHATDRTKLLNISGNENAFDNFERFTDEFGTQIYANDYKIDHYAGYAVTQGMFNGSTIWENQIDWAIGLVHNGFDDWRIPNINELTTWIDWVDSKWFDNIGFVQTSRFASSTSEDAVRAYGAHNSSRDINGTTGNVFAFAIRNHY